MTTDAEIEAKFWKALADDRVAMLGLESESGHTRPMSAQIRHETHERGPIWFFSVRGTQLTNALDAPRRAVLQFSSKGHEVFASVQGELSIHNDRAIIDELWNRFVAAWYEGGKDDPRLALLRFEPDHAEMWLNEFSLVAGVKRLLGRDPKADYRDKVADIQMGRH
jgi:general stress protein 26